MTSIASAKPTWARPGVATRSPAAQTPAAVGLHQLVHFDEAALVHLDAAARGDEPVAERPPPHRDDHHFDGQLLTLAEAHRRGTAVRRRGIGRAPSPPCGIWIPPSGEGTHDHVDDVLVDAGEKLREGFEHRYLGPEVGEHRRELAADRSPANDGHRLREVVQRKDLVARQDAQNA